MSWIHPLAVVEQGATVGDDTCIWAHVQIRAGARIGRNCVLGRNSFVDTDVTVGDNVKVQNNASLYAGLIVEDGVFIGPHVIFTNDRLPRAITPTGQLKRADQWTRGSTRVCYGAAIGAGCVIVSGVDIGRWAMIGSGATVTHNVPDFALMVGSPARVIGWVSAAGTRCNTQDEAAQLTGHETSEDAQ